MAKQFIVTVECANGNESVGEMWTETAAFSPASTLADVEEWLTGGHGNKYCRRLGGRGRVTLTYDDRSLPPIDEVPF